MSNALAIASVTRVLKDLLNNGLIDHNVNSVVGSSVTVTALPPDRLNGNSGGAQTSQLNLFLHKVTPNLSWRSAALPTRDGRGERVNNQLLPLNLHYLLTAYGSEELHAEILLGYAMLLLDENAILSREAIRIALAGSVVNGSILPPAFEATAASELADQVELIKITMENLSTDDMSKLWTASQTHYRLTAAYEVSVVLIESLRATRTPLPVLTRGPSDAGVAVQPNLLPPFPTIELVTPANKQTSARMDETVTVDGHHLAGDTITVRLTEPRAGLHFERPALAGASDKKVQFTLPLDSPGSTDDWRAGVYSVAVVVTRAGEERSSNELPLVLVAKIDSLALTPDKKNFEATFNPPVAATQRASLILGDREIPAGPISSPPPQTRTLLFDATGVAAGTYWRRLRIDGVESILINRSVAPPAFHQSEQLVIP